MIVEGESSHNPAHENWLLTQASRNRKPRLRACESIGRPRKAQPLWYEEASHEDHEDHEVKTQNLREPRDTNALKFVFVTRKRVSVTNVTASLGHSAANGPDAYGLGSGVGRAVSFVAKTSWPLWLISSHALSSAVAARTGSVLRQLTPSGPVRETELYFERFCTRSAACWSRLRWISRMCRMS